MAEHKHVFPGAKERSDKNIGLSFSRNLRSSPILLTGLKLLAGNGTLSRMAEKLRLFELPHGS